MKIEIQKSEKQLLTETIEDQRAVLNQFLDSSKAKMINNQKLIDKILLYYYLISFVLIYKLVSPLSHIETYHN